MSELWQGSRETASSETLPFTGVVDRFLLPRQLVMVLLTFSFSPGIPMYSRLRGFYLDTYLCFRSRVISFGTYLA